MKDGFDTDSGWPKPRVATSAHTVSRRQVLRLAAGIGLSASLAPLLAACGGDDDDDGGGDSGASATQTPGTEEPATEAADTEEPATQASDTRELEDMLGPVTVPANPARVIASSTALGNMLALGVRPVGTNINVNSVPRYLADQMEGIADVTGEGGIDVEKALALDPDLIIAIAGSGGELWNKEVCERYKAAVTTFCYDQSYVYEEDIKQNVVQVAHALGIEDRADAVLAEYYARIADLKQKVSDAGFNDKPVTVVRIFQDGNYSIRIGTSESIIFRAVGIPQPPGQQDPEEFSIDLSMERLDVLNEAYAVVIYIDDNSSVTKSEILDNDVWRSLTPVQEDRVVFVSSGVWNSIDIQGAFEIMDDVETLILPLAQQDAAGQGTAAPGAGLGARTIEHIFGETVIEGQPERIVTVGLTDQDPVFALGLAPVASQPWYAEQVVYPWAEEALAGIDTEMLPAGELDIEAVAAHDPDLIIAITSSIDAEQYDLLSRIAPTIASSTDYDAATIPWQEQMRIVGQALGMEDLAEERIAGAEQEFAEAAERNPDWAGAEALLASQYIDGQLLVYPSGDPIMGFLTGLGFTIAPELDELMNDDFGVPTLSAERFNLLEVDLVLWDGNRDALEASGLFDLPTFTGLAVVQEGRMVFPTPEIADALSFKNVLSLPWALRQLEDDIAAALDGDPETTAGGASDET